MGAFEYLILFFSFIYTLGLTHLLFAMTRMIRHRRELVFSWPHGLWMAVALVNLLGNWLSLYDFRHLERVPLGALALALLLSMINYFQCALVSPDFERGESYDMEAFNRTEGPTYIGVVVLLAVGALGINYAASAVYSVTQWGEENGLVLAMLPPAFIALVWHNRWVQIACPLAVLILTMTFVIHFYPVLER